MTKKKSKLPKTPACKHCYLGVDDNGADCDQCQFDCVHCLFNNAWADCCYDYHNDFPDCPMKVTEGQS